MQLAGQSGDCAACHLGVRVAIGRQHHPDSPGLGVKLDHHVVGIGLDARDEVDVEADSQTPVRHDLDEPTELVAEIKRLKLKVQAAIQGDAVRVTGAKRDDLQAVMALLRKEMAELPLSFDNFRD